MARGRFISGGGGSIVHPRAPHKGPIPVTMPVIHPRAPHKGPIAVGPFPRQQVRQVAPRPPVRVVPKRRTSPPKKWKV